MMEDDESAFDFGAWCSVCDKAIPQLHPSSSAEAISPAPTPSPTLSTHNGHKKRNKDGPQPPSAVLAAAGVIPHQPAVSSHRRNKSSSKLHHAGGGKHGHASHHGHHSHGHRKSTATFAALAPLHPASPTPAPSSSTTSAPTPPTLLARAYSSEGASASAAGHASPDLASGLYCSEECRRIDEMRSRTALMELGQAQGPLSNGHGLASSSSATIGAALPLSQRRTSSTLSLATNNHSFSTPNLQNYSLYSPSFTPTSPSYHHPYQQHPAHPAGSASSVSLASHGLDFSTRRNSRGSAGEGAYSFRPSLMQRLPSSDDGGGGPPLSTSSGWRRGSTDSLASMGETEERVERSARPPSALSALRRMTPISATSSASPPTHPPAPINHYPSHLANPSRSQSHSQNRSRPPQLTRHNSDAPRPTSYRTDSEESRSGRAGSIREGVEGERRKDKGKGKHVASPPLASPTAVMTGFGSVPGEPSFGKIEETSPRLDSATARPSPLISRRSSRSASSASLALLGSSFGAAGRSYDPSKAAWALPRRTESTASLSALVATGEMVPVGATPIPTSNVPRVSTSTSSPSSNASSFFGHSNSSVRSSSQRSTAGSSDQPPYDQHQRSKRNTSSSSLTGYASRSPQYLSSSAGSQLPPSTSRESTLKSRSNRPRGGLMMTPSGSSLSNAAASSYEATPGPAKNGVQGGSYTANGGYSTSQQNSTLTTTTPNANPSFSQTTKHHYPRRDSTTSERTPTQSLSKASTLPPNAASVVASTSAASGSPNSYHSVGMSKQRSLEPRFSKRSDSTDHLSSSSHPRPMGQPANAVGANPGLQHMYPSPGKMAPPTRNWSWDQLAIPTYTALDVDKVRNERQAREQAASLGSKLQQPYPQQEQSQGYPQPQQPRERKRLFYFSDSAE